MEVQEPLLEVHARQGRKELGKRAAEVAETGEEDGMHDLGRKRMRLH